MGLPMQVSAITAEVSLRVFMGPQRYSWHNPPRLTVTVEVGRPSHWHGITSMGRLRHSCSHGIRIPEFVPKDMLRASLFTRTMR